MNQEEMVSMRVNTFIKFLSIEILNQDGTFLTETFFDYANILYAHKGKKNTKIWYKWYFIVEEESI